MGDQGILEIGDTLVMHAVAEVYEQDVGKVAVGQTAKVRVPTLGEDLTGKVVRKDLVVSRKVVFSNDPVADIDARVVEVRIELGSEDSPQGGRAVQRQVRGRHRRRRARPMRSPFRGLPIAWLQLKHGRTKLVAAVVGIVFADLLMWMQLGFLGAALASATTIHRQLRGDLVIINPHTHQITSPQPFPRRLLTRAKGHPEVDGSHSALHGHGQVARSVDHRQTASLRLRRRSLFTGDPCARASWKPPACSTKPIRVYLTAMSRKEFGQVAARVAGGEHVEAEVNGLRRMKVVGTTRIGANFAVDGNLVTSDVNFLQALPRSSAGVGRPGRRPVATGGADPQQVQVRAGQDLRSRLDGADRSTR